MYPIMHTSLGQPREKLEGTLLASAERTATTNSPEVDAPYGRGVMLFINITVAPGTAQTLELRLQQKDPVSGSWNTTQTRGTISNTADIYTFEIYPGSPSAVASRHESKNGAVARRFRVAVVHSSTGSWTYSLGYCILP